MAKVNIVDRVKAMENEDKVKELISKQVRLPATIVGGKKRNGEETIQYRCAYCGHTWNRYYKNQYILTGEHLMEYLCKKCGSHFFQKVKSPYASVECPTCGYSSTRHSYGDYTSVSSNTAIITMLGENTVFIRAGILKCDCDENWKLTHQMDEYYRTFITLNPGNEPKICFLAKEGCKKDIWKLKKNYVSDKFHFSIFQLEFIGELDALKYTGFKEYVTERVSIRSYNPLLTLQDIISYVNIPGSCRLRFTDSGKPDDRDVLIDAVSAKFDNKPDDRYSIANAPLSQLTQIYTSIDNGKTVQVSIITDAGEQILLVHGYDKYGNLFVAECDSLADAGKINIQVCSQVFWDGRQITMRSWFEFRWGELSSENGDIFTSF